MYLIHTKHDLSEIPFNNTPHLEWSDRGMAAPTRSVQTNEPPPIPGDAEF